MNISTKAHGNSLQSLLIMPIQQSPRRSMQYNAILKSFKKLFPESKCDQIFKKTIHEIDTFISTCNSAIGDFRVKKICQHIEWGDDIMKQVVSLEFEKQLRGSSRLPCKFIDSGRLLSKQRTGFIKKYEPRFLYLFDDILIILRSSEKSSAVHDIIFLQQCVFPKTKITDITKKGSFSLIAPSLKNQVQIMTIKFRGVTSAETLYWHGKIKEYIDKKSRLVVQSVSRTRSKTFDSLKHIQSVESIGSVDTDSDDDDDDDDLGDRVKVKQKGEEKNVFLHLQFGAENLRNRDGYGVKAFGISDPYFEIWNRNLKKIIFKSEVIRDDLNPTWAESKVELQKIRCAMICIRVWDLDKQKSDYLGEIHTTWSELCSLPVNSKLKLHDEETKKYEGRSGNLILLKWEVHSSPCTPPS